MDIFDEILEEIKKEEKEEQARKEQIIKNGCHHTNKIEKVYSLSKKHYLESDVCYKQFNMDGTPKE